MWRHGSVVCLGIDSWRFSEPLEVSFLIITTLHLTTCPVLCGAMGACLAVDEAAARSRSIDRQLGREFSRERRIVKLLLLGTGQAGVGVAAVAAQLSVPLQAAAASPPSSSR